MISLGQILDELDHIAAEGPDDLPLEDDLLDMATTAMAMRLEMWPEGEDDDRM